MAKKLTIVAVLGACALASGCVTLPPYEWGGYESSLYAYAKHPEQRPQYKAALEQAVSRGRQSNRVAPGLLAELGYLYLEDGDAAHAIPLFEEEMKLFPESRSFLNGVIARAGGDAASTTQVKS
jgi:hypothetical protein